MEQVFARAAERGVAMEINSQPDRIDLKDVHARLAKERGVRLLIDTDAHSTMQLENIRFGVFAARRAGLTRDDVLNTLPFERFEEALRRPSRPAGAAVKATPGTPTAAAPAKPVKKTAATLAAARVPAKRGAKATTKPTAKVATKRAANAATKPAAKASARRGAKTTAKPTAKAGKPAARTRTGTRTAARTRPKPARKR
jgi:hypothetical protein